MMKPKPFPNEMQRLRDMLDDRGIEWQDASEDTFYWRDINDYSAAEHDRIWRTNFETDRSKFSVICGFGSYGGEFDLLECMVNGDEPNGYMSADNVIEIVDKELV